VRKLVEARIAKNALPKRPAASLARKSRSSQA